MKQKFIAFLILIAALSVSGSAAFYSVYGLSKLFAGASLQVIIMAGSLEFSKLVVASALHQYWTVMNKIMRIYLSVAVLALILITSAGIYGFLSSAYQETAAMDSIVTKQINILEMKKDRYDVQRNDYVIEKKQIDNNISQLRTSLSNPNTVQYVDKSTGQLVTTTSSTTRKSIESQLNDAIVRRNLLSDKLEVTTDSLTNMEIAIVEAQSDNEVGSELGPLKYMSGLTGKPMDVIVNWFLFLLIFVFDPLAVTLIVLANFAFDRIYIKPTQSPPTTTTPVVPLTTPVVPLTTPVAPVVPDTGSYITVNTPPDIIDDNQPVTGSTDNDIVEPISINIVDQIKAAIPWINYDKPESPESPEPTSKPTLSDSQKKNMSYQEIEAWYKNNSI